MTGTCDGASGCGACAAAVSGMPATTSAAMALTRTTPRSRIPPALTRTTPPLTRTTPPLTIATGSLAWRQEKQRQDPRDCDEREEHAGADAGEREKPRTAIGWRVVERGTLGGTPRGPGEQHGAGDGDEQQRRGGVQTGAGKRAGMPARERHERVGDLQICEPRERRQHDREAEAARAHSHRGARYTSA